MPVGIINRPGPRGFGERSTAYWKVEGRKSRATFAFVRGSVDACPSTSWNIQAWSAFPVSGDVERCSKFRERTLWKGSCLLRESGNSMEGARWPGTNSFFLISFDFRFGCKREARFVELFFDSVYRLELFNILYSKGKKQETSSGNLLRL